MDERSQRQLRAMIGQLNLFGEGKLDLGTLIDSLEGLFDALEKMPSAWRQEFRENWGALEEAYAVASDEERTPSDPYDVEIIGKATSELRHQVESALVRGSLGE